MATNNSTATTHEELAGRLHDIAAMLAGVTSVLKIITDTGSVEYNISNSISLVSGTADRLNSEICDIADVLGEMDKLKQEVEVQHG